MSLADLLDKTREVEQKKIADLEITKERVREDLPKLQKLIAYWRVYPDKFIDYLCSLNPDNSFHFFFYQRLFLRAVMRHKYVYCVFCRGYSKSFLTTLASIVRCILYPGCRIFVASGGKEQSASILAAKFGELCKLIPALQNEVIWDTRGTAARTRNTKDSVIFTFKNGSSLENLVANERSRGQRFTAGVFEECVSIDQDILNDVLLPTLNVSRRVNGKVDPDEILNQSQVFVKLVGQKVINYCF